MKLSINNYRRIQRAEIELAPIALVAGLNGEGKTSTAQAMQAALLRTAVTVPGALKKDAPALVTRGTEHAWVTLADGDDKVTITYPACKVTEEGSPAKVSGVAAGLRSLTLEPEKDRADLLARYVTIEPSYDDLRTGMKDAGYSTETIEKTISQLESSTWDEMHAKAAAFGTAQKGKWEQVTGEKFGSAKVKDWTPEGWEADLADADLAALQTAAAHAVSDWETATRAGGASEAVIAELNDQINAGKGADVENRRSHLQLEQGHLDTALEERAKLPPVDVGGVPCPQCGTHLVPDQDWNSKAVTLRVAEEVSDKELKERRLKLAELDGKISRLRGEVNAQQNALANAEAIAARAAQAKERLEKIRAAGEDGSARLEAAVAARDAANRRLRMFEQWSTARTIATVWARTEALVGLLAPTGLRQQALGRGLDAFNAKLAEASAAAGWQPVRVDAAMAIWYGTEPYWLCSEAQQMRVAVTLQVVMAGIEGAPAVVIDRADRFDAPGRFGLFKLLVWSGLKALVLMTANKPDQVPRLPKMGVVSYWLSNQRAEVLS